MQHVMLGRLKSLISLVLIVCWSYGHQWVIEELEESRSLQIATEIMREVHDLMILQPKREVPYGGHQTFWVKFGGKARPYKLQGTSFVFGQIGFPSNLQDLGF